MEKAKTNNRAYKFMVNLLKVLIVLIVIVVVAIFFVEKKIEKQKEEQANAKIPIITKRISEIVKANNVIYDIEPYLDYDSVNFIHVYVTDTWFKAADTEKKRFAMDVRDNVKAILFEEGFIKAKDRVGIYVYTIDGIPLAENSMYDEIKLKE